MSRRDIFFFSEDTFAQIVSEVLFAQIFSEDRLPKFDLKIRLSLFSQAFSVVSVGFIPILCYTDPG